LVKVSKANGIVLGATALLIIFGVSVVTRVSPSTYPDQGTGSTAIEAHELPQDIETILPHGETSAAAPRTQPTPGASSRPEAVLERSRWTYRQQDDAMRNTTWRFAELQSRNTLHFDAPYSGGSTASIILRRGPDGLNAMIQISRGQFTCWRTSRDHVSVRFDEGAVQRFACGRASSGESRVIFIQDAARFERQLRSSQQVIVEAEFYQHGRQQLVFETANLDFQ
jgi:hypothetical protein